MLTAFGAADAFANGYVDGSADDGKARSTACGACHGADGNSVNPQWPSLAGQHASYIVRQLNHFKGGQRANVLMTAQAMPLSETEVANLAVYYAEQTPAARAVADPKLVDKGEALYRGGDKERGIPACMACHGPTGAGNPGANYPRISGQWAIYTETTLKAYRSGERKASGAVQQMGEITSLMTDEQIKAVASYLQGLR